MAKRKSKMEMKRFNQNRREKARLAKHFISIPIVNQIPESSCRHCEKVSTVAADKFEDCFDLDGYPIPLNRRIRKKVLAEVEVPGIKTFSSAENPIRGGDFSIKIKLSADEPKERKVFRFLDLPPELRNRIYEYACVSPKDVVCIPDKLLRPSNYFGLTNQVGRKCTLNTVCASCQLHQKLGTININLSRTCQQIHDEMVVIPCTVNTFGCHNLYYLSTFLIMIGKAGRNNLMGLRFDWKMPEEEAHSLQTYTNERETYRLLSECKTLVRLEVDMHVGNMLSWSGTGNARSRPLSYVNELPGIEQVYELRGIKDTDFSWEVADGLEGMGQWALWVLENWNLSRAVPDADAGAEDDHDHIEVS